MTAKTVTPTAPKPVQISSEAHKDLATKMRDWSGWRDASLVFGVPSVSPFAQTEFDKRKFTVNADRLMLNPNRVLLNVTPFRLRQEAVLTGAMLHEVGHARYSKWLPRTPADVPNFLHSDGAVPTKQCVALARLLEEPRIEGRIVSEKAAVGVIGLDWTMRAAAAALLPTTPPSVEPGQRVMDFITSWALRAGRQYALLYARATTTGSDLSKPKWVKTFDDLLQEVLVNHLVEVGKSVDKAALDADLIVAHLLLMVTTNKDKDNGPFMIDKARTILLLLFPEGEDDQESPPMPGGGCSGEHQDNQDGEPGDEPGEEPPGDSEPGDDLQKAAKEAEQHSQNSSLSELEKACNETAKAEQAQAQASGGITGAAAGTKASGGDYRAPTAAERQMQHGAEKFLRNLIKPSETSKNSLSEAPSATVDAAELAAWRAGGQVRDPHFFVRTRRTSAPQPPVKVAILVDVSGSMDVLAKPSSVLSWALSCAALDLRNFAGRGVQVESTLICWGNDARVVAKNGVAMPGIKEWECREGTDAMGDALDLIESEIPDFFDTSGKPSNRLLVQFTDWELNGGRHYTHALSRVRRALECGVNMLTVAPPNYANRRSVYADMVSGVGPQRGSNTLIKYNDLFPEIVWDSAAQVLAN